MNPERMRIYCEREMFRDSIVFYMFEDDNGRNEAINAVTDLLFDPIPEGVRVPPAFTLSKTSAQRMMDELWNCGLRPSEGSGSAGQLASVQYHLEDMRKLVFNNE